MNFNDGLFQSVGFDYVVKKLELASPYGVKELKTNHQFTSNETDKLNKELDNVQVIYEALGDEYDCVMAVRHCLSNLRDLFGTLENAQNAYLGEIELFELTSFSIKMNELVSKVSASKFYSRLQAIKFTSVDEIIAVLCPDSRRVLSFYIEDSRSPELQQARREKREAERLLREIDENKGANREATLAKRLVAFKQEELALAKIYRKMTESLRPYLKDLIDNAKTAGKLDLLIAKALIAKKDSCTRPVIEPVSETARARLFLHKAVNPIVNESLQKLNSEFTPISLDTGKGVTVLTGANMGGKSVALQTIALNVLLALHGFFVYCEEAVIPLFDRLELINKDFSNLRNGLSSFGGEIIRFNEAVKRLGDGGCSLIVMDEFARGTNSQEGEAIARSTVEFLSKQNAVTIFATHYEGVAGGAIKHYQVRGLKNDIEVSGGDELADRLKLIEKAMDYGLIEVELASECPKDAIRVCKLLGLPDEILDNLNCVSGYEF